MMWRFVCLCTLLLSSAHSFVTGPLQRTSSAALLSLGPEDAMELVNGASDSLNNYLSSIESPTDAITKLPNEAKAAGSVLLGLQVAPIFVNLLKSVGQIAKNKQPGAIENSNNIVSYPEGQAATYEMNDQVVPFEFGDAALVRPLLKQSQLESRALQVVYDANRDGYDPLVFHKKVDGKGAAVVLLKVAGKWCGGYNPRGWASLGQARSSVAAFLFYQKGFGGWQKIRVSRTGSMACGNDLYNSGIYFGADSLVLPLTEPNRKRVSSRLGQYFEPTPDGKYTILPRASFDYDVQELKVLTGVYAPGEGTYKCD